MNFLPFIGLLFTALQGYFLAALLVRDPHPELSTPIAHASPDESSEPTTESSQPEPEPKSATDSLRQAAQAAGLLDAPADPGAPTRPATSSLRWVRLALMLGLGYGLSSLTYFTWRALLGSPGRNYLYLELAIILVLLALYLRAGLLPRLRMGHISDYGKPTLWRIVLPAAYLLGLVGVVSAFLLGNQLARHGSADAWAVWNLGARFLMRGGAPWTNLFSPLLAQPDQPLMLSASVARMWIFQSREVQWAPQLIGLTFGLSLSFLAAAVASVRRGRLVGYAVGLVVLGASGLVALLPAQVADLPLAFYYLAAALALYLYDTGYTKDYRILVFAGLCTGFAIWTYNFAWVFLLALISIRLLWIWRSGGSRRDFATWQVFALGLLPLVIYTVTFRLILVPNAPTTTDIAAFLDRFFSVDQLVLVVSSSLRQLVSLKATSVPYLLLIVFVLLAGRSTAAVKTKANRLLFGLILVMFGFSFLALLNTAPSPVLPLPVLITR
ncbi:MAG: hypothetical protein ACK2UW_15030, partial [Anaerolineales bacterium]